MTLLVERLVAPIAFEGVGRNVSRLFVGANRTLVIESLITVRAFVRFIAGVQSHVDRQTFLVVQHLVAKVTLECFLDLFVNPRVDNQIGLVVEALEAYLALIGLFAGMQTGMNHQLVLTFEHLPARDARIDVIYSVLTVNLLVTSQSTLGTKLFGAHPALKNSIFTMRPHMLFHFDLRIEKLCTDLTTVGHSRFHRCLLDDNRVTAGRHG